MSNESMPSPAASATINGRNSFGAFMKLFRISNSPTVVSNSLVGAAVATAVAPGSFENTTQVAIVTAGVVMIYIAGMAINDYIDQVVDGHERPTRPIPAGQISPTTALMCGMILLVAGMAACAFVSLDVLPWVMLLASAVLAYNMLHLAKFVGPLLMGVCRALIPVIAAISLSPIQTPAWNILVFFALPLGLAGASISLVARNEMSTSHASPSTQSARTMIATALMGLAALAPLGAIATRTVEPMSNFMTLTYVISLALVGISIFRGLILLGHPYAAFKGVMRWIAALSLMDAASLCILNQPVLAYASIGCFILAILLQRRVAGS